MVGRVCFAASGDRYDIGDVGSRIGGHADGDSDGRIGCARGHGIGPGAGDGPEVCGPTGAADRCGCQAGREAVNDRDRGAGSRRAEIRNDDGISVARVALGEVARVGATDGQIRAASAG